MTHPDFQDWNNELQKPIDEKIKAQEELHVRLSTQLGRYIERIYPADGICWNCHKQIFNKITLEEAKTQTISGCPYCHRSFAD